MRYVYGQDELVAKFVQEISPNDALRARGFNKHVTIGVIDDEGKLVGGVVFHGWQPEVGVMTISAAGLPDRNWFTRDLLDQMYGYAFDQHDCQMVLSCIPDTKPFEGLLLLFVAIGYAFVRIARLYGRDCDAIVATLTKEQWAASRFNRKARKKPEPHPLDIPDFLDRRKEAA